MTRMRFALQDLRLWPSRDGLYLIDSMTTVYIMMVLSRLLCSALSLSFCHSYTGGPRFICVQYTMSFLKDDKFEYDNLTSGELRSCRSHNFLVEFIEVREK